MHAWSKPVTRVCQPQAGKEDTADCALYDPQTQMRKHVCALVRLEVVVCGSSVKGDLAGRSTQTPSQTPSSQAVRARTVLHVPAFALA